MCEHASVTLKRINSACCPALADLARQDVPEEARRCLITANRSSQYEAPNYSHFRRRSSQPKSIENPPNVGAERWELAGARSPPICTLYCTSYKRSRRPRLDQTPIRCHPQASASRDEPKTNGIARRFA